MKRRPPLFLISGRGGLLAFHTGEHANDDWRPDAPGSAAHAFATAALRDAVSEHSAAH